MQPLPQSCSKTPIPSMPLAPNSATVFSALSLVLVQVSGAAANVDTPMTCTGNDAAVSPDRVRSTAATGPQL